MYYLWIRSGKMRSANDLNVICHLSLFCVVVFEICGILLPITLCKDGHSSCAPPAPLGSPTARHPLRSAAHGGCTWARRSRASRRAPTSCSRICGLRQRHVPQPERDGEKPRSPNGITTATSYDCHMTVSFFTIFFWSTSNPYSEYILQQYELNKPKEWKCLQQE